MTELENNLNNDARKTVAVQQLLFTHLGVARLWKDAGLLNRKNEGIRQHNAWEHMASGALHAAALGQLLVEKGYLDKSDLYDLEEAFLLHDADKDTESKVINIAKSDEISWDRIEQVIKMSRPKYLSKIESERIEKLTNYLQFEGEILDRLKNKYADSMQPEIEVGERIYIARDLIVGEWHDAKLAFEGIDPKIIEIQSAVEYSACPLVDKLIDQVASSDLDARKGLIKIIVTYLIDNGMRNSEFVDHITRADEVFQKPANQLLSQAYSRHSTTGETALEIQKRVGQKAVDFISGLIGIDSSDLVKIVKQKVQESILSV